MAWLGTVRAQENNFLTLVYNIDVNRFKEKQGCISLGGPQPGMVYAICHQELMLRFALRVVGGLHDN
jgi:hypothetical protein